MVDHQQELARDLVTVVIPARNEEATIAACLQSVLSQDEANLQVLVVDGASTDRTVEVVKEYVAADPRVELLHNPERIVPTALNRALAAARGAWFVRVDAHATVPADYVRRAVAHLRTGHWGGVGGRKDGVGRTPTGRAIAAAMASPFGVGGSRYHYATVPQIVDHVPFGAYPTALARQLGGWNEQLVVNQDFEFDYRVRQAGHELLLDPSLRIAWESRQTLADLFAQYRRYGRGKVEVMALHPRSTSPRHLAAPALLAAWAVAALFGVRWRWLLRAAFGPYAVGLAVASAITAKSLDEPVARRRLPGAFLAMHLGWGVGFWEGVLKRARRRSGPGTAPREASGAR